MEDAAGSGARFASRTALVLAIAGLFVAPYVVGQGTSPARYLLPDLVIAAIVAARFRADALRWLGLAIPPRHALAALALLGAGFVVARAVVAQITAEQGLAIVGSHPGFSLSQVLHQEIVLRGLLLGSLVAWIPSRPALAIAAAVLFTGVHPLFSWWSQGLLLPTATLATLFGFALATNLLFLRTGHVGFSFAVHGAWNLARFGDAYTVNARLVSEAQSFTLIEGSALAVGAAFVLLAVTALSGWVAERAAR